MEAPGKAHFIGICGVGMSATAKLLKDAGWQVSGSDDGFYPPVSLYLEKLNIPFFEGYRPENIPADVDLVVIGKNAKLVREENEEVAAAYDSGVRVASFPEIIGELASKRENIVVAGSYGKSTTTALLAWCLLEAGRNPSYFIGAIPIGMEYTSGIGESEVFVLEGDEYPSANDDKRSKFLHYAPHDVLLTSAAHDHVNVFPTLEDYLAPFRELLGEVSGDGRIVACIDNPNVEELVAGRGNVVTYGFSDGAKWSARDISYGETTTFVLTKNGEPVVELSTKLLGKHNVQNIIGAAAMLLEKELLSPEELAAGVVSFSGIVRRLDKKTDSSSVSVYEGFGSSYEKARSVIEAMKLHFPARRLVCVFEPHTFSWRNRASLHWYDDVFDGCDEVLVYEPASQGAATHKQLTQDEIVERIGASGIPVTAIHDKASGLGALGKMLRPDDVVLLNTSGDLGGLIEEVPKLVEEVFPKKN